MEQYGYLLPESSPFNVSIPLSAIWYVSLSAEGDKYYKTTDEILTGGTYNDLPYWAFDASPEGFQKAKQYYTPVRQISGFPETVIPNSLSEALMKCIPASVGVPLTGARGRRQYDPFFRNVRENFAFFVVPTSASALSGSPTPHIFVSTENFTNPNVPYYTWIPVKYNCELFISPDGTGTLARKNQYNLRYNGVTSNSYARQGKPRAAVQAGVRKVRTRTKLDVNWFCGVNASLSGTNDVLSYLYTQSLRNSDYGRKNRGTFEVEIGPKFAQMLQGLRYYGKRFNNSVHFASPDVAPQAGDVVRVSYKTIRRANSNQVMINPKPVYAQHARGNQNVDFEYNLNFYSYEKSRRFFVHWYDQSEQRWAQSYVDYTNSPNVSGSASTGLSGSYRETRWHKADNNPYSVFGTYRALSASSAVIPRDINLTANLARTYITGNLPVSAFYVNPTCTFSVNSPIAALSSQLDTTLALVNANINVFTSQTQNISGVAPSIIVQKFATGVANQFRMRVVITGSFPVNSSNYFINVNNTGWVAWPGGSGGTANFWDSIRSAGTYTVRVRDVANRGADGSIAAAVSYPGADPVLPAPPPLSATVASVPLFVSNAANLYRANPAINIATLQAPQFRTLSLNYNLIASDFGFTLNSVNSMALFLSSARIRLFGNVNMTGVTGPVPVPYNIIGAPIGGAPSPTGGVNETMYTINTPFNRTGSVTVTGSAPLTNYRLWAQNRPTTLNFSQVASLWNRRIDLTNQIYGARTMTAGLQFQTINPRPSISVASFATGVANQFRMRVTINGPLTINGSNYFIRVNNGGWVAWPGSVGPGPQSWDSIRTAGTYTVYVRDGNNIGGDGSIAAVVAYPGPRPLAATQSEYKSQTQFTTYNIWKTKSRNYTRKFSRDRRLRALGY